MKTQTIFITFDGLRHDTHAKAGHHLDVLYGETLSKIAHNLLIYGEGKYTKTGDWIDENLNSFMLLKQIKDDNTLISDEDE